MATSDGQAKRAWAFWLSWFFSLVFLVRGMQGAFDVREEAPPGVGLAVIVAAFIIMPPIAKILRRTVPQLRPLWAPPVLALAIIMVTAIISISSTTSPGGDLAEAEVAEGQTRSEATSLDEDLAIFPAFAAKTLKPHLRDPDSARITDLMAFKTGERLTLCGMVNARNGLGGYTGPQPFIISDSGIFVGEGQATAEKVYAECKGGATRIVPDAMLRN